MWSSPGGEETCHNQDSGTWALSRLIVQFIVHIKTVLRVTKGVVNSDGRTGVNQHTGMVCVMSLV